MTGRALEIFREDLHRQWTLVSRLFAGLMLLQWAGAVVIALVVSPRTWISEQGRVHENVWTAIVLGGILSSLPVTLGMLRPTAASTRHVIAAAQALFSALLIHLTGGRMETHFHIFGSLAFLAFYRDWRVLATATALTAADHWWRGVFWPQSVFGVITASPWRWLEHAGWVVFEDTVLVASCIVGMREMRRMAEGRAAFEASRAEVEEQVRARTAELQRTTDALRASEKGLREANRNAEAANSAKSEFLANMSHEIRTPMAAIIGYADLLQDPSQKMEDRIECVQVIRRNGEHLLSLINDILDLSKIEAGKMSVESIDCSPVQIVQEVYSLMQVRAEAKGISLRIENSLPLPRFKSDPVRLRQILLNLVGNAIKFTVTGEVVVRTSMDEATLPGGLKCVRLEVADTGIGMSAEAASRLFQPFSQADSSTTRRFGGTGLGLMISRRLALMLGGNLMIQSAPGEGTTASVLLHVRPTGAMIESVADGAHNEVSVEGVPPAGPQDLPALSGRILLAEDGPDNQRLISFHLRRAGAEVMTVETGTKAVEQAIESLREGGPFGLILMDMQMPEMDGYAATTLLRQRGWTGPIVALTAHAMSGDRDRCLQAGCDDYLTKPIDKARLLSMCNQWLANASTNKAA